MFVFPLTCLDHRERGALSRSFSHLVRLLAAIMPANRAMLERVLDGILDQQDLSYVFEFEGFGRSTGRPVDQPPRRPTRARATNQLAVGLSIRFKFVDSADGSSRRSKRTSGNSN